MPCTCGRKIASAGNRTRVTSMATMYSATRPLMRMIRPAAQKCQSAVDCNATSFLSLLGIARSARGMWRQQSHGEREHISSIQRHPHLQHTHTHMRAHTRTHAHTHAHATRANSKRTCPNSARTRRATCACGGLAAAAIKTRCCTTPMRINSAPNAQHCDCSSHTSMHRNELSESVVV